MAHHSRIGHSRIGHSRIGHSRIGHNPASHSRLVLVGRHAALFDKASGVALRWLYRGVADRVVAELPAGAEVLDVGTGPGRLLLALARRRADAHVVGIDPSADMVAHALRHTHAAGLAGRVEARVATAEALPFPDASFDAVVSSLSAHHWADASAAIAEQARVLRPAGQLWVFDLRAKPGAALTRALYATFPAGSVGRPRLAQLPGLVIACHRAVKPDV